MAGAGFFGTVVLELALGVNLGKRGKAAVLPPGAACAKALRWEGPCGRSWRGGQCPGHTREGDHGRELRLGAEGPQ